MIDYKLPFYSNTPDNKGCFQAVLLMLIKHFWPEEEYTFEELNKITAKKEGGATWPTTGLVWLAKRGVTVTDMEIFDFDRFTKEGAPYLLELFGEEMGTWAIENSDIELEQKATKEFIDLIKPEQKIPTIEDIIDLLNNGYVSICQVNSRAMNDKPGYVGHFVIIKGLTDDGSLIMHDPGLPGMPDRIISTEQFQKGWAYPDEKSKNIMAVKYN